MAAPLLELLADWLPHQRWYPRKGVAGARLSIARHFQLPAPRPEVTLLVLLVRVDFPSTAQHDAGSSLTLQVPLSIHQDGTHVPQQLSGGPSGPSGPSGGADGAGGAGAAQGAESAAFLGELEPGDGWPGGSAHDGIADPEFLAAWLGVLAGGPAGGADVQLWLNPTWPLARGAQPAAVRLLGSEQSNSSVIFSIAGRALIAKFYRVVHEGAHPEVEIGKALGVSNGPGEQPHVPVLRAVAGLGPAASGAAASDAAGAALFVLHDFIAGASDGWAIALAAAGSGADFSADARAMGVELARLHGSLRRALGAREADEAAVAAFAQAVSARLEWAWELAASAVGPYESQLRAILAQLHQIKTLPPLQRIHGDLHLGQLIRRGAAPGEGWYILDFEGEPLRPLADRGAPDVALRDLAGMLRSFDYAAAQARDSAGAGSAGAANWSRSSADAFMQGYESVMRGAVSRTDPLFVALWLDKALYEVVYELQNRPDWVWVPVNAVRELFRSRESGLTWH